MRNDLIQLDSIVEWRTPWCQAPVLAQVIGEYDDAKNSYRIKTCRFGHVLNVPADQIKLKETS
jgi:hypothetical protein